MMWGHCQVSNKIVKPAYINGKRYAKRHGKHHEQRVDCTRYANLGITRQHVANKVYKRNTWHYKQSTSHQGVPRGRTSENIENT